MMDHLTRCTVRIPVRSEAAETLAHAIFTRIISVFGPPETLHSDQGAEFENKVVHELKKTVGNKQTRTTPYRPQGVSASERVHPTMNSKPAMHTAIDQSNWASHLPFVPLVHNAGLVQRCMRRLSS